jgi:hypothetical protein
MKFCRMLQKSDQGRIVSIRHKKNPWPRILRHGVARRAVSYKPTRHWRIAEPEPAG